MTDKKLSNLDKVRLAWPWGWSAVVTSEQCNEPSPIVYFTKDGDIRLQNDELIFSHEKPNYLKIHSFIYAGQLAGSEPIPEGQRFRIKKNGRIFVVDGPMDRTGSMSGFVDKLKGEGKNWRYFHASEIEPYFE